VDRWDGQAYRRVLTLDQRAVEVSVGQIGRPEAPRLQVSVADTGIHPKDREVLAATLERLLGLRIDLTEFYRFAFEQKKLASLVDRFRGMKPPRFASIFECLVNAMACQQVSLTVGLLLLSRLAENYGLRVGKKEQGAHAFPRPEDLAQVSSSELRRLGFSEQKSRAVIELARRISEGQLDLEELTALPDSEAIARLQQLRGVGRWTAEYVLLRGLGRWHIFPGDDVGARRALARWRQTKKTLDYDSINRALRRWRPYAGLIYFHLLLNGLAEARYLT
jgi:DNA-3-methyladenine glycosylase II